MNIVTRQRIEELIREAGYEDYEITFDSKLGEDLGYDSLDRLDLVLKLEKEFEITISDEVFDKVRTVGDVMNLIASYEKK